MTAEASEVRRLNRAFHREQAVRYDDGHDLRPIERAFVGQYVAADDRVLDLGTGTGLLCDALPTTDVVGVDLSRAMLAAGDHDGETVQAAATRLPLASNSVDAAIGRAVLHHVPDVEAAVGEVARVVRSGGRVVLTSEPVGMPPWRAGLKRLRSRLGHLLGRHGNPWKRELAAEHGFPTGRALTWTVNVHERKGINPTVFDGALDRHAYYEYRPADKSGRRFVYLGTVPDEGESRGGGREDGRPDG